MSQNSEGSPMDTASMADLEEAIARANAGECATDPLVRKLRGDFIREESTAAAASDKSDNRTPKTTLGRMGTYNAVRKSKRTGIYD